MNFLCFNDFIIFFLCVAYLIHNETLTWKLFSTAPPEEGLFMEPKNLKKVSLKSMNYYPPVHKS